MSRHGRVPAAARSVREEWDRLSIGTTEAGTFDPGMLAGLPEPARRWLGHALAPGTPLWQTVELSMTGRIRLGRWRSFTARQVLAPPSGFIWAARARVAGLPVTGFDRYSGATGEMGWRLLGLLPVMSSSGPDVSLSAAGRLAGEAVLVPTMFQHARWEACAEPDTVVMAWRLANGVERTRLRVGADGRLLEAVLQRWGNPDGAPFGRYPFGVSIDEEATFAGVRVPSVLRAGWWWGTDRQTDGEFFRARIVSATFG
ncbi:hypothetical protein GCM10023328_11640 [Modestobacter marinus]|uniref:Uncharacterized protein n=1 Tax=Modestobacter marinus TaxID=477641 RepID=A0A846LNZ9_9ACTN|nr:DUF6544 family protein [Modestobacter marinus]NIH69201.1 hypothetical protein [Modestobacter marinus]GGL76710.1 hypothetical protein GCM10011589_35990 [Modestobacter marinus]